MKEKTRLSYFQALSRLARKSINIVIACHRRADPDSYCSAFALENILRKLNPRCKLAVLLPDGPSKPTEALLTEFGVTRADGSNLANADLIILVDVGHESLLSEDWEGYRTSSAKKVILDHHSYSTESPNKQQTDFSIELRDDTVSSTCQLVSEIVLPKLLQFASPRVAQSLLVGIIFDSQNLRLADCRAMNTVSHLCSAGAEIGRARKLLFVPRERSEAIARLKGAQRTRFQEKKGWIIAQSIVSSFQASVARGLIELGADFAVVAGAQEKGKTICSLRATQHFVEKTGVELASTLLPRVKSGEEEGGGHPTAATVNSPRPPDEMVKSVVRALNSLIEPNVSLEEPMSSPL